MDKKEIAKRLLDLANEENNNDKANELINIASFITDTNDTDKKEEIPHKKEYSKDVLYDIKKLCAKYNIYFDENYLSQSISEFVDRADWADISYRQKLSENFIREFQNKVDWYNVSRYQKLSEEFIREFKDKVDWRCFSKYQKLSEEFIREFKDKVDWYCVSRYQKLSENFIREFENKVC